MDDEELKKLHRHYAEKYGKFMLDESAPTEEERRLSVLVAGGIKNPAKDSTFPVIEHSSVKLIANGLSAALKDELVAVQECALEFLFRQLKDLALAMYIAMKKTKNWGLMGEQHITLDFCRTILDVPNDSELDWFLMTRFFNIVAEYDRRHGNKSGDEYIQYCKKKPISFFGKEFYNFSRLDNIIALLDTDCYFYSYNGPFGPEFILGQAVWTKIDDTDIYSFEKEYIRSPGQILAIVGRLSNPMQLRRAAVEVVCFDTWQHFFDNRKENEYRIHHPNIAICEGLKGKAMFFRGITAAEDYLAIKSAFINDFLDGIIWHEFGHLLARKNTDAIYYALGAAIRGDNPVSCTLEELLADWAWTPPVQRKEGKKSGTIARLLELSTTDEKNASALFYQFMSENWHAREEDRLPLRSHTYLGLGLCFIDTGGYVDFNLIAREHGNIYAFLLAKFNRFMEKLFCLITRDISFQKNGRMISYHDLEAEILKSWQEKGMAQSIEELRKQPDYWKQIKAYLKDSKEGWEQFMDMVSQESELLEYDILDLVTGGNTARYDNSLRSYIIEGSKETGIYKSRFSGYTLGQWELLVSQMIRKYGTEILDGSFDILSNFDIPKDRIYWIEQFRIECHIRKNTSPARVSANVYVNSCCHERIGKTRNPDHIG
jgi:hypothetical protein